MLSPLRFCVPFAAILLLSFFGVAIARAQADIPTPEEIVSRLLPDEKAEGIFKSWKGIDVERSEKADNKDIPSFTLYVTFEFNSSELTTDGELLLSQAGLALVDRKLNKYTFFLGGHTDAVGGDAYNVELSQRRAERVRNYLIDHFNIKANRLIARGYGESRLLISDDPEADANRRVEIKNIGPEDKP